MRATRLGGDSDGFTAPSEARTEVLGADQERKLLERLVECKAKLTKALSSIPAATRPGGEETPSIARYIASINAGNGREQARLGAIFHQYTELRDKLALANMRLVAHVAKRFRGRGIAYSDLLQEGFCGLLEAIDRFDLTHETKLATYATWWIRQAIGRAVENTAHTVRIPAHIGDEIRRARRIQAEMEVRLGRPATLSELAEAMGITEAGISELFRYDSDPMSLDVTVGEDGDTSLGDLVVNKTAESPFESVASGMLPEEVSRFLSKLSEEESQVLTLRYGLDRGEPRTQGEVGEEMQLTAERVRRIERDAIGKLRRQLAGTQAYDLLAS